MLWLINRLRFYPVSRQQGVKFRSFHRWQATNDVKQVGVRLHAGTLACGNDAHDIRPDMPFKLNYALGRGEWAVGGKEANETYGGLSHTKCECNYHVVFIGDCIMTHYKLNKIMSVITVAIVVLLSLYFYYKSETRDNSFASSSLKSEGDNTFPKEIITNTGIELILIPAGEFIMGCISDDCPAYSDRKAHNVIIREPFYLGKYQITQRQWEEVMGNNPSLSMHDPESPVDNVTWYEVQDFIKQINIKEDTAKYRLPTEAEWEYAARAGTQSKYFWGDNSSEASKYGWYKDNSNGRTYPVGAKLPNPWGLYDILGNVEEWVQDWYDFGYYENSPTISPSGPNKNGNVRVLRGGSWAAAIEALKIDIRFADSPDFEFGRLGRSGFRLAASINEAQYRVEMVYVNGGEFIMGCTTEQEDDCRGNEKPAHKVLLSDFYIGKYAVTQAQWKAVMGNNNNPSLFQGNDHPVEMVNWISIQEFIRRLNEKTGKNYRLPTEAEWEYAARGGNQSRGYKYSGSNNVDEIAWYFENSEKNTHPVGTKNGNELGIFDMSGNVFEWVEWVGDYDNNQRTNPKSPTSGQSPVSRGGGITGATGLRVSFRNDASMPTGFISSFLGFRLAHDL